MFCLRAPVLASKVSGFTLKIGLIISAGSVRDGVRGHGLDGQHQGRMVGLRMSQRGARLHQLGRTGGLHQGQAQRAGAFKCQVEVFLMQGDAKTRRKCAFDHSLTMHFKYPRCCKTTQQRLPHGGRVGTGLGGKDQSLAYGGDVQGYDNLVGNLAGLAVAVATYASDVFTHQLKQRADAIKHRRITAHHDGQGGVARPDLTARQANSAQPAKNVKLADWRPQHC